MCFGLLFVTEIFCVFKFGCGELRQANTKWKENYILSHVRTSEAYAA